MIKYLLGACGAAFVAITAIWIFVLLSDLAVQTSVKLAVTSAFGILIILPIWHLSARPWRAVIPGLLLYAVVTTIALYAQAALFYRGLIKGSATASEAITGLLSISALLFIGFSVIATTAKLVRFLRSRRRIRNGSVQG